ncbi:MAG: alkaline phosphatase family protein [Candidatus Helarchaeota archaeon]|nr:alkaline phosphatase family protein [Candidatus Helarchaeota archaeon]
MTQPKRKLLVIGVDQMIPYLMEKYVATGDLPNIASLLKKGVYGKALSSPPCDTPTNWTVIATGAPTFIHGATSFYLHVPGEPLDLGLSLRGRTQLSKYCNAEYFWDVAARHGKIPFVINYPAGWPSNFEKGAMVIYTWPTPETLPRQIIFKSTVEYSQASSNSELQLQVQGNDSITASLNVLESSRASPKLLFTLLKSSTADFDTLQIQVEGESTLHRIKVGEISEWLAIKMETKHRELPCIFRIKLVEIDSAGKTMKIERSPVLNTKGWSQPDDFGEKLLKNRLTLEAMKTETVPYMMPGTVDAHLIYARQEVMTLAKAIEFAKKELDWDLCFFHIHHLDTLNHKRLAAMFEPSPNYSEKAAIKAERNVRVAYKIVDEMVGYLLETCVDENTTVVLVADHGAIPAWRIVNIPLALYDAGLLHYDWNEKKKRFIIDWSKTKAFPYLEPTYIWVNLKGRDPEGIVEPEEYEQIRDEVIKALEAIRDPDTGNPIIELAMRKEDHPELAQNGERIGDIVYFLKPPYQIFDDDLDALDPTFLSKRIMKKGHAYEAKHCFGAHAYYLPQTTFGDYSIAVPLVIAGPGIKEGVKLETTVNLIDLAPTFARIMSLPKPKHSTGRIIAEIFK